MAEITIMKIGFTLIVPIQIELHDKLAVRVQEDIIQNIEDQGAKGLLIDVSKLHMVDSFLGRLIGDTAAMAEVMGCCTVLVGLQPEVAITLMELGVQLEGVLTALNAEMGLEILERIIGHKAKETETDRNVAVQEV